MQSLVTRYSTPFIAGLFALIALSGVALFFEVGVRFVHGVHEWLGVIALLPIALIHVWKNFPALKGYARRGTLVLPLVISALLTAPFIGKALIGGDERKANPAVRATTLLTRASLTELAPILETTPDALLAKLRGQGLKVESTEQTLQAIAATSDKRASELLTTVLPAAPAVASGK